MSSSPMKHYLRSAWKINLLTYVYAILSGTLKLGLCRSGETVYHSALSFKKPFKLQAYHDLSTWTLTIHPSFKQDKENPGSNIQPISSSLPIVQNINC